VIANTVHLPFKKRIEFTGKLGYSIEELFVDAESHWFYVSEGQLTGNDINDLLSKIKEKRALLERAYICESTLPYKSNLETKAAESTEIYFKQYLFGE
jgi:hypothetical protein